MAKLAAILSHHDCVDEARPIYREVLSNPVLPRGCAARRQASDGLACLALYHDRQDLLAEAKVTITAAVRESPDEITIRVTLGGVLCELGDVESAEPVLTDVLARSRHPVDRAIAAAYLALITARKGDSNAAMQYAGTAQASAGEHRLVRRLLDRGEFSPGRRCRAPKRGSSCREGRTMRVERVLASVLAIAFRVDAPWIEVSCPVRDTDVSIVRGSIAGAFFSGFADLPRDPCLERTRGMALRDIGRGRSEYRVCPRRIEVRR